MSFTFVFLTYTLKMKSTVRSHRKVSLKQSATNRVRTVASRRTASSLSRIARSTKRIGKQTLRDILLSKTFNGGFKVFIGLLITGSALYGAYAFIGESIVNDVVVSQSEIIARISKHTQLPEGTPEAIVRVQDAETLHKQATLYENVKEGDYIVIYPTVAVVYDLLNDRIVALKSLRR